jgi:hypothetical protein
VVTEVYTPGLFFTLGVFVLLQRAHAKRRPWLVIAAGLVAGLGLGMHMSIATCGLGYAWLVFTYGIDLNWRRGLAARLTESWKERLRVALGSALAAIVGAAVFLYIPLRTFERWDRRDWVIFSKNVSGGTFKRKFLDEYDLSERVKLVFDVFVDNLHFAGLALAAVGFAALLRNRPRAAIGLVMGAVGNVYWFFNYNVPDLDVFFLPAVAIACIWLAFGIDGAGEVLGRVRPALRRAAWVGLSLPAWFVYQNFTKVDLSRATEAQQYAEQVCETSEEPGRIALYSSPKEWRYYSVFLYARQALGLCDSFEIWRKPGLRHIADAVKRGRAVYTFVPLQRLKKHFVVEQDGRLFRLRARAVARTERKG